MKDERFQQENNNVNDVVFICPHGAVQRMKRQPFSSLKFSSNKHSQFNNTCILECANKNTINNVI